VLDTTDLLFGELIVEEGAEAHWVGALVSGGCEISVPKGAANSPHSSMGAGAVFGVSEFMGSHNAHRAHTIITNTKSTVASISHMRYGKWHASFRLPTTSRFAVP
jgi:hypothetical protein